LLAVLWSLVCPESSLLLSPPPVLYLLFSLSPPLSGVFDPTLFGSVGEGLVGEGDPSVGRCDGYCLEVLVLSWVRVSVGSSGSTSSWVGSFSVVTYSVTMEGAVEVVGCASPSSPLNIVAA